MFTEMNFISFCYTLRPTWSVYIFALKTYIYNGIYVFLESRTVYVLWSGRLCIRVRIYTFSFGTNINMGNVELLIANVVLLSNGFSGSGGNIWHVLPFLPDSVNSTNVFLTSYFHPCSSASGQNINFNSNNHYDVYLFVRFKRFWI